MRLRLTAAVATTAVLLCTTNAQAEEGAVPFTAKAYALVAKDKAVVLLAANWARRWGCGGYENVQLQRLGFDRAGTDKAAADPPDVVVEDSSWLPAKQGFVNYALIVPPGDYLLSDFKMKAAKSMSQVGGTSGNRASMITDGKSKGGSFTVAAGEVVYIGHFAIDCAGEPMPWRYYPEDKEAFAKYLQSIGKEFTGLPVDQAKFRLFDTTVMGRPFILPD